MHDVYHAISIAMHDSVDCLFAASFQRLSIYALVASKTILIPNCKHMHDGIPTYVLPPHPHKNPQLYIDLLFVNVSKVLPRS
jgi:hypothetical protein